MKHVFTKLHPFLFTIFVLSLVFFMLGVVFVAEAKGLVPCEGPDCNFDKLIELTQEVIDFLIVIIASPLATVLFAYAGWLYMSAGGDPGKVARGHQIFRNVLLGLVIALAAWLIVSTISSALLKKDFKSKFFFLTQTSVIEHRAIGHSL